ncbi:ead/Ea22-like family protein [Klebsiella michiganensis]
MNDITELAQSMKAATEKWQEACGKYDKVEITVSKFIRAANQYESIAKDPANIIALVEALEKAQANITKERELRVSAENRACGLSVAGLVTELETAQQVDYELCKLLPPGVEYMDPPDGGDVTPLEGVRRMVADYRQRIAELESRTVTVKLPESFKLAKSSSGLRYYYADEVDAALTAAGIKVEAE